MYKTLKYVIEFPGMEERKKLKVMSIKTGVSLKNLFKYMILQTLHHYNRGEISKDKIMEVLNDLQRH